MPQQGSFSQVLGHFARAASSRDLVQGQKALAAASMGGTQGQLAQVSPCLAPTFMVNTQHQAEPRPAGKLSYGNRHRPSKHPNYGSQTGRGLAALFAHRNMPGTMPTVARIGAIQNGVDFSADRLRFMAFPDEAEEEFRAASAAADPTATSPAA